MSATRVRGACPDNPARTRYRNRAGARKGLHRTRECARRDGVHPTLWPVDIYRCRPRPEGGCGGWHLRGDPDAGRAYLASGGSVRQLHAPTRKPSTTRARDLPDAA